MWINTLKIVYYNTKVNGNEFRKGVPQGYLTSPEMFKRHINPGVNKSENYCISQYLFLDDWALLCSGIN